MTKSFFGLASYKLISESELKEIFKKFTVLDSQNFIFLGLSPKEYIELVELDNWAIVINKYSYRDLFLDILIDNSKLNKGDEGFSILRYEKYKGVVPMTGPECFTDAKNRAKQAGMNLNDAVAVKGKRTNTEHVLKKAKVRLYETRYWDDWAITIDINSAFPYTHKKYKELRPYVDYWYGVRTNTDYIINNNLDDKNIEQYKAMNKTAKLNLVILNGEFARKRNDKYGNKTIFANKGFLKIYNETIKNSNDMLTKVEAKVIEHGGVLLRAATDSITFGGEQLRNIFENDFERFKEIFNIGENIGQFSIDEILLHFDARKDTHGCASIYKYIREDGILREKHQGKSRADRRNNHLVIGEKGLDDIILQLNKGVIEYV